MFCCWCSQFWDLGYLLGIKSQPQPPACCVTLTKSFSSLWIFPYLKMDMSHCMSRFAPHALSLGISIVPVVCDHSTCFAMTTSRFLGNSDSFKKLNIIFNRLQMDDTGRLLPTLTFLTWSSCWHCPLGLSTWIMCLKPQQVLQPEQWIFPQSKLSPQTSQSVLM